MCGVFKLSKNTISFSVFMIIINNHELSPVRGSDTPSPFVFAPQLQPAAHV